MMLTLKIISGQQSSMGPDSVKIFNGQGGSIGRVVGNDWVLPDTDRYLSSHHCEIHFRDGEYYLEDVSTNGVLVNAANEPLGKGQSLLLHNGDHLNLGNYEIAVEITQAVNDHSPASVSVDDPFAAGPFTDRNAVITNPDDPAKANFQDRVDLHATDPLELIGKGEVAGGSNWAMGIRDAGSVSLRYDEDSPGNFVNTKSSQASPGSQADNLPGVEEFFQPPSPHNEIIPDDWDMNTGFSSPTATPAATPVSAPFPSATPAAPSTHSTPVAPTAPLGGYTSVPASASQDLPPVAATIGAQSGDDSLMRTFLEGAGIADVQVAPEQIPVLMRTLGQMTSEMIQGMMEMLMARASLKSEFRMSMTTIRPVENNPLKFCVTADDALRTMLIKEGGGYLPPLTAILDGFDDIKDHHMALMAGMQASFESLLQRFNPQDVEGQAEKGAKLGSLLPAGKKARAWELYVEMYKALAREAEDNFQGLLGEEFTRAYEEQIQKIDKLRPR